MSGDVLALSFDSSVSPMLTLVGVALATAPPSGCASSEAPCGPRTSPGRAVKQTE